MVIAPAARITGVPVGWKIVDSTADAILSGQAVRVGVAPYARVGLELPAF